MSFGRTNKHAYICTHSSCTCQIKPNVSSRILCTCARAEVERQTEISSCYQLTIVSAKEEEEEVGEGKNWTTEDITFLMAAKLSDSACLLAHSVATVTHLQNLLAERRPTWPGRCCAHALCCAVDIVNLFKCMLYNASGWRSSSDSCFIDWMNWSFGPHFINKQAGDFF